MYLFKIAFFFKVDGSFGARGDMRGVLTARLEMAKFASYQVEDLFMGHIAGSGHDEVIWSKPRGKARFQHLTSKVFYRFGSAQYRASQRVFRPKPASENFVQKILGVVHVHLDFFQDDLLFLGDIFGIKIGTQDQIGDNVEGDGEMFVEDFGVEADLFLGGEGVKHAADGIHFTRDSFRGAALGAFENHVLDEVAQAVFIGRFAARTAANPHADGNRA